MKRGHGDAPRLLPHDPRMESAGAELTPAVALLSTFTGPGAFGRMLPDLPPFRPSDAQLEALGEAMEDRNFGTMPEDEPGDNPEIPAGYTYLGQFVDHDITFDKTEGFPLDVLEPELIRQARTPSLDLDSLYGMGPELQPELYEEGVPPDQARFRLGPTRSVKVGETQLPSLALDLPRQGKIAVIGDPRNDENVAVAQLHRAFLQFHNRVLDEVLAGRIAASIAGSPFAQARQIVRWHYQWVVLRDLLEHRLVKPDFLQSVLRNGRRFFRWEAHPTNRPFMPIEFSVAAYRVGHSMVRQSYHFNRVFNFADENPATLHLMFRTTHREDAPIPTSWVIDWGRFFKLDSQPPNPSRKLDTRITRPLRLLPDFTGGQDGPQSLAKRNLLRGSRLGLPSGQAVADRLGIPPLTPAQLSTGKTGDAAATAGLVEETPLWFYILKEAEMLEAGVHLGPVGSTLLAEVFVGLLEGDPESFLHADPRWTPTLGLVPGDFSMPDLLGFVGDLNPLGDK